MIILISCLLAIGLFSPGNMDDKNADLNKVKIIAHRGASYDAPENTLAAVNLAWQKNADAVEVDVHLSKDNRLMVIHDKTTGRTTDQDLKVAETPSSELRTLDVGKYKDEKYQGEKIPFLEEVINRVPQQKQLFIEIKCGKEAVPVLKNILLKFDDKDVVVISFNYEVIEAMEQHLPDIPCYWLIGGKIITNWSNIISKTLKAGAAGLNLNYHLINKRSMKKINSAGFPVYCWTVDDPNVARKMIRLGVEGITTNRPEWLMKQLK